MNSRENLVYDTIQLKKSIETLLDNILILTDTMTKKQLKENRVYLDDVFGTTEIKLIQLHRDTIKYLDKEIK